MPTNFCSSFSKLFADWRPNKRRKTISVDLETANELDLNCVNSQDQLNSEESENQSDLEENLLNKKLGGNRLTSARKEVLLSGKDSQNNQTRKNKKTDLINKNLIKNTKELDDKKQSNLELLRKIFPAINNVELVSCLLESNNELVKAIQQLVLKQQQSLNNDQLTNKQQSFDDKSLSNRKTLNNNLSTGKQLNDSLVLNENNVLNNIKANLQNNLQNNLQQNNLQANIQQHNPQAKHAHSPLFNSPCHSPSIHGQLFKEAFRTNNNLFYTTNSTGNTKTTDTLCSSSTPNPSIQPNSQPLPNSNPLNTIQVNHLLQQHSSNPTNSYLSMLASMSNQMENNCFNNQNLFDPILHPLNDAMLAMANHHQQLNKRNSTNNPYNGNNQTTSQTNNKNSQNNLTNLNAFQRTILNENGFPYPLYPFLFPNNELNNSIQTENNIKNSLVAAIAQQQQQKNTHIQQATELTNGQLQFNQATNENLMNTFNHLLSGQDKNELNVSKEKDSSLTSGSSACSTPETNNCCSPIKFSA